MNLSWKNAVRFSALSALLLAFCTCSWPSYAQAPTVLRNANFDGPFTVREAAEVTVAEGWDYSYMAGDDRWCRAPCYRPEYTPESEIAVSGTSQRWFSTFARHYTAIHQSVPTEPGQWYTFACQVYDPSRRGHAAKQQVSVKCIDKRSGRVVHSGKFPSMVSSYELVGDPEKKTVELRLNRAVLRLQLTDEEIPPEAETDGTTGRALLDALRKGLMDAIEGSPDE